MGRNKTLDWDAIGAAYTNSEMNLSEIATKFGCTVSAVMNIAKNLKLTRGEKTEAAPAEEAPAETAVEPEAVSTAPEEVVQSAEPAQEQVEEVQQVAAAETQQVEAVPETTPEVVAAPAKKTRTKKVTKIKMIEWEKKQKAKKTKKTNKKSGREHKLDWDKVAKAYMDPKKSLKEVSKEFNCSLTAVLYVAKQMKLKSPRRPGRPASDLLNRSWKAVVKRYHKGDKIIDIAKDEGVQPNELYRVLVLLKVPKRKRIWATGPRSKAWKKAVEMFEAKQSMESIAKEIKQSVAYTRIRLRSLGCDVPSVHQHIDIDKAKKMYAAGKTSMAIAAVLHVSPGGVCSALKRAGIKLRPKGKKYAAAQTT